MQRVGALLPRVGQLCRTSRCVRQYWRGRSIIPIAPGRDSLWDEVAHSLKSFDNVFRDLERSSFVPWQREGFLRPILSGSPVEEIQYDDKVFQIRMDVRDFGTENLTLSIEDDVLTVKGKYEKKEADHGTISREFVRQYTVPQNVDSASLDSTISNEGVLTIRGTVKSEEKPSQEKVIEIQRPQKKEE